MALRLLLIVYLFEAGLFFLIAPWTRFWSVTPLLNAVWWIEGLSSSPILRGLVSGFGFLHFVFAAREIILILAGGDSIGRTRRRTS